MIVKIYSYEELRIVTPVEGIERYELADKRAKPGKKFHNSDQTIIPPTHPIEH